MTDNQITIITDGKVVEAPELTELAAQLRTAPWPDGVPQWSLERNDASGEILVSFGAGGAVLRTAEDRESARRFAEFLLALSKDPS